MEILQEHRAVAVAEGDADAVADVHALLVAAEGVEGDDKAAEDPQGEVQVLGLVPNLLLGNSTSASTISVSS